MSQTHPAAARRRDFVAEAQDFAVSLSGEAIRLARTPAAIVAALLILPVAGFLTGMGIVVAYGEYHGHDLPDRLMLSRDNTISERFEYTLTGAATVAMLVTWRRTGAAVYGAFAVLFGWLTADNSLQLHEQLGGIVAPLLTLSGGAGDNAHHLGEAAVLVLVGVLLVGMIASALSRSADVHRLRAAALILLTGCAAFFGVVVDAVDALVLAEGSAAQQIGAFVEDAGELWLLCLSAILAMAIMFRPTDELRSRADAHANARRVTCRTQAPPRP